MTDKLSLWFKEEIKQKTNLPSLDLSYFNESWIDPSIIEREGIIKEMSHFIGRCITNRSQHLCLYGNNGTGKTFCFQTLLKNLNDEIEQTGSIIVYANTTKIRLSDIIIQIANMYQSKKYEHIIFIFDEIDKLARIKDFITKAILPFLTIPHVHFMIALSQKSSLTSLSDICGDVDVSAFFEHIEIPIYTENELFAILDRRFTLSKVDKVVYQGWAIQYIAQQVIDIFQGSAYYAIYIANYMISNYYKRIIPLRVLIDECITNVQKLRLEKIHTINFNDLHIQSLLQIIGNHVNLSRTELYKAYCDIQANPRTTVWMHKILHRMQENQIISFIENSKSKITNHYIQLLIDPKTIPQR